MIPTTFVRIYREAGLHRTAVVPHGYGRQTFDGNSTARRLDLEVSEDPTSSYHQVESRSPGVPLLTTNKSKSAGYEPVSRYLLTAGSPESCSFPPEA